MINKYIGSSFDDFLEENELLSDAQAIACSPVVAWEIEQYLSEKNMTKTEFAAALKTSRAALDRLVNPENTSVNLNTLAKAGEVMGKKLELRYVWLKPIKVLAVIIPSNRRNERPDPVIRKTVSNHRTHIMNKFQATSIVELTRLAIRNGIIEA